MPKSNVAALKRHCMQGLQKMLFDLVQRLDSVDPQAIQTAQKRLRKLETGFKRISEQW